MRRREASVTYVGMQWAKNYPEKKKEKRERREREDIINRVEPSI